jgi:hypothetical protein
LTELPHALLENAVVQAFLDPILLPPPLGFRGGPVLGEAEALQPLRHWRYGWIGDNFRDGEPVTARIRGAIAYGGPILPHFGHMVAEGVHRIIPARHHFGADRFLFATTLGDRAHNGFEKLPSWMRDLLGFLEVTEENCRISNENVEVEALQLAAQGNSIGAPAPALYLDLQRDFAARRLAAMEPPAMSSRKVYVSRGAVEPGGNILGEAYLESLLEEMGFSIFHPEKHPLPFQLQVYAGAETLIFCEGSAVHGAALLGREMMGDVSVLVRRPNAGGLFRNTLLGRCRGLRMGYCSHFLGTMVLNPGTGEVAVDRGVSVFNVETLRQHFLEQGEDRIRRFDRDAYFAACEADLMDYLRFYLHAPQWPKRGAAAIAQIFSEFENARRGEMN